MSAHCNEEVETIILVDGCRFSEKDGLDFTFFRVHDRRDRRGGRMNTRRVQEELALRIQNGGKRAEIWRLAVFH